MPTDAVSTSDDVVEMFCEGQSGKSKFIKGILSRGTGLIFFSCELDVDPSVLSVCSVMK